MFEMVHSFFRDVARDARLEAKLIPLAKEMVEGKYTMEEAEQGVREIMKGFTNVTDRRSFANTFQSLRRQYASDPAAVGRATYLANEAASLV